jgi:uncharacterized protein (TIGR00106 family)
MLVELSIIPVGSNAHTSAELAKALRLIDASGLLYRLTPSGTCIEGEWDTVMPLVRRCHERVRKSAAHVITMIKIEDDEDERHKLTRNVASVEEKVGHSLGRTD